MSSVSRARRAPALFLRRAASCTRNRNGGVRGAAPRTAARQSSGGWGRLASGRGPDLGPRLGALCVAAGVARGGRVAACLLSAVSCLLLRGPGLLRRLACLRLLRVRHLQLRQRLAQLLLRLLGQQRHQRTRALDAEPRLLAVALAGLLRRAPQPEPPRGQVDQRDDRLREYVLDVDAAHLVLERRPQFLFARLLLAHVVTPSAANERCVVATSSA